MATEGVGEVSGVGSLFRDSPFGSDPTGVTIPEVKLSRVVAMGLVTELPI